MNNEKILDILKEIPLFEGFDREKIEKLASIARVKKYTNDSTIFFKGEQSHSLMIVTKGVVRICKHNQKGDKINIGIFKPYSFVAEAVTLKQAPYPASAYAEDDVEIIYIKINEFRDNFLKDANVSYLIIESLLGKIRMIETNIEINIASSAKDKIYAYYKKNEILKLGLKNYEIASLLGMSPETFSRNIKQLEKEKLLLKIDAGYEIK